MKTVLRVNIDSIFNEHIELFETFAILRAPEAWEALDRSWDSFTPKHETAIESAWEDYLHLVGKPLTEPQRDELFRLTTVWLRVRRAKRVLREAARPR